MGDERDANGKGREGLKLVVGRLAESRRRLSNWAEVTPVEVD